MFNPADKQQTSDKMRDLLQQIDDLKKKRTSAVERLKQCVEEVTKDIGTTTQIFKPAKHEEVPPSAPAVNGNGSIDVARERALTARCKRKSSLEDLKRTSVRAVNGAKKTRYLDPKLVEQAIRLSPDGNLNVTGNGLGQAEVSILGEEKAG